MSKISEFPRATEVKLEDLILLSKFISEGKYDSNSVPLSALFSFFGAPKLIDVGVNLSTITEQGVYILQGGSTIQDSYQLGYPTGVYPGARVMMLVSSDADGSYGNITQHYFHSLNGNPLPWSRYKSINGGSFNNWTQPVSQSNFDTQAVQQLNVSTYGIELQSTLSGRVSVIYPFPAVGPESAPNKKTSPTLKQGVHFSIKNQKAGFYTGAYRGNVMIVDEDNRMFLNVDKTFISDADNPKGVNWKEMLGVYLNDKETLSTLSSQPSSAAIVYTLNKIIDILRDINVLLPGNTVAKTVSYEGDGQEIIAGAAPVWVNFLILPADAAGKLYIKSDDETILVIFNSETGEQVTGGTLTESIDMVNRGSTPETAVQYGSCTIKVKGLKEGSLNLIAATDSGFNNVVGTMEIAVKPAS